MELMRFHKKSLTWSKDTLVSVDLQIYIVSHNFPLHLIIIIICCFYLLLLYIFNWTFHLFNLFKFTVIFYIQQPFKMFSIFCALPSLLSWLLLVHLLYDLLFVCSFYVFFICLPSLNIFCFLPAVFEYWLLISYACYCHLSLRSLHLLSIFSSTQLIFLSQPVFYCSFFL